MCETITWKILLRLRRSTLMKMSSLAGEVVGDLWEGLPKQCPLCSALGKNLPKITWSSSSSRHGWIWARMKKWPSQPSGPSLLTGPKRPTHLMCKAIMQPSFAMILKQFKGFVYCTRILLRQPGWDTFSRGLHVVTIFPLWLCLLKAGHTLYECGQILQSCKFSVIQEFFLFQRSSSTGKEGEMDLWKRKK